MNPQPPISTLFPYTTLFRSPKGNMVSVGGEIGEVGKYNTQPDEVRAYMDGLRKLLGNMTGNSKISVQTGTSHGDRKSTRLNSSHPSISYAVFCLKKKKTTIK